MSAVTLAAAWSSSAIWSWLWPARSATWRAGLSGATSSCKRPAAMSAMVPTTWAHTSATDHPWHRVGERQPASSMERIRASKPTSSSAVPATTSVLDKDTRHLQGLHTGCSYLYCRHTADMSSRRDGPPSGRDV